MSPAPRRAKRLHGRGREVDAVLAVVRRQSGRCVTVTGPIGIGKSRLLEELAPRIRDARLNARVLDDDVPVSSSNASGAPADRVTAARALLDVPREEEVALGLLPVPTGPDASDATEIRRSPAVALLADAAGLDLETLTDEALGALARIAVASDGHPAVLEQLAGWLWILAPRDLVTALDEGTVDLLSPDLLQRLRSALAGLDPEARDVIGAVAETIEPFDLETARAAVAPPLRARLPGRLATLAASGLLLRVGANDEPRWKVLRAFRPVFLGAKAGEARRRLTAHFAGLARPLLATPIADRHLVRVLRGARDELVACWEDAHATRDPAEIELAVALASVLWDGDGDLEQLAARIVATLHAWPDAPARARLELAASDALWLAGDARAADAMCAELITTAERAGDVTLEAVGYLRRAMLSVEVEQIARSEELLARGTKLAEGCGEPRVLAFAFNCRAFLLRARGDTAGALAAIEMEVELARGLGDTFYLARAESHAADCHVASGQYALGFHRYDRARRAMSRVAPGWARTLEGYIGLAALEAGAPTETVRRCRRALTGAVAPRFAVVFAAARAAAAAELGDHARAATLLSRAEEMLARHPSPSGRNAVHAADLLVAFHAVSDEASRASVRTRIEAFLAGRRDAAAKDERPFVRALERATTRGAAASTDARPDAALEGRPRLVKMLAVLREAGGSPVDADTLFGAVWPDEHDVDADKARARVRKAISLMRDLGLRGALVKKDGGYALRT